MFPLFNTFKKRNLSDDDKSPLAGEGSVAKKQKVDDGKCEQDQKQKPTPKAGLEIPGLMVVEDFITLAEQDELIKEIQKMPWSTELKRKVQQWFSLQLFAALSNAATHNAHSQIFNLSA